MLNSQIKDPKEFAPVNLQLVLDVCQSKGFSIPIYQRLYAWSNKEITKLLEDINNTYTKEKLRDYYIGNLTLNYNKSSGFYDIIDGQQRMTTLWLIGLVLRTKTGNNDWWSFLQNDHGITLSFTAREDDNLFLINLLRKNSFDNLESSMGEKINPMMVDAIVCIQDFIRHEKVNLQIFSDYILNHVKMVAVFLPDSIDLNKYFEDLNNRGLQLEPHHIVKAMLLKDINISLQANYAKIWDAVSQMNQYIEYGFEGTLQSNRNKLVNITSCYFNDIQVPDKNENAIQNNEDDTFAWLIKEIIKTPYKRAEDKNKEKEVEEKMQSIVSFPEFLLHCLRMFFPHDVSISVDDKKLTETFSLYYKFMNAAKFIEFLFEIRILFDKFIIKSVSTNEGTSWEIRKIKEILNENDIKEFERKNHMEGLVTQLQSMLYVSTSTSLWLTKALEFIRLGNVNNVNFLNELEHIDKITHFEQIDVEELCQGTSTFRYWFYKLDYLLWKKWTKDNIEIPGIKEIDNIKNKIRNFQFRDNRSVEHIHPQNPNTETWIAPSNTDLFTIKNQFGNIALISVRSNSSYNNQLPALKKDDFIKRTKYWGIESLKLLDVYKYEEWTIANMKLHQDEMFKILEEEYTIRK